MLNYFDAAYYALHLCGYYDGTNDSMMVKAGFENAKYIMDQIKPQGAL
jgi:hypothetical protein